MANIIDSFFIALGIRVDPSGLEKAKGAAKDARESILSMGTAITGLVAGLALHKVAEIGNQFEQNTNQIAGFLNALGLSSSFNAGLTDASKIMQKITADAARLPGEAADYIEVFKTNAAFLKTGLPGSNANQIADWTNRLTAVAKSVASNLDSAQIARESAQLLAVQGRAGGHNVLWQRLLPFLMQVEGQSKITATAFNAMAQPARVKLLGQAFDKLQPLLDKSATSFDAMSGAFKSNVTQLVRLGTADLFEGMKNDLNDLNNTFFDTNGNLTETGHDVVNMISLLSRAVATLLRDGKDVVVWLAEASKHTELFKVALGGLLVLMTATAWSVIGPKILKLAAGVNVATIAVGILVVGLGLLIDDIWTFYQGGESVTGMLVSRFEPALYGVIAAALLLGFALSPITTSLLAIVVAGWFLASNWDDIVGGMTEIWDDFVNGIKEGLNTLQTLGLNKLLPETFTGSFQKTTTRASREGAEGDWHDENYRRNIAILHARRTGALEMSGGDINSSMAPVGYASAPPPPAWIGGMSVDPRSMMSGGGNTNITNGPVTVNITESKDATATGREVHRAIRTAQTRKKS